MKVLHMPDGKVQHIPQGVDYRTLFDAKMREADAQARLNFLAGLVVGALLGIAGLVMALGLPLPLRFM